MVDKSTQAALQAAAQNLEHGVEKSSHWLFTLLISMLDANAWNFGYAVLRFMIYRACIKFCIAGS